MSSQPSLSKLHPKWYKKLQESYFGITPHSFHLFICDPYYELSNQLTEISSKLLKRFSYIIKFEKTWFQTNLTLHGMLYDVL